MNEARQSVWLRTSSVLGFLLLWQVVAAVVASDILPSPVRVLGNLWLQVTEGDLLHHLFVTLLRVSVSFLVAMLIGTVLGYFMGRYRLFDACLDGLLVLALNIPALVTIVLSFIWFGLTDFAAVFAVVMNKTPMVMVNVREGTRSFDRKLQEVASVYRVPWFPRVFHVLVPQLAPYLMASARSGLALIWKIVLVVELLGRSNGVGFKIGTFFHFFDITSILAYTVAFGLLVLLVEAVLLRPIDRGMSRWRT